MNYFSARPECFAAHEVRTSKMYRRIRVGENIVEIAHKKSPGIPGLLLHFFNLKFIENARKPQGF